MNWPHQSHSLDGECLSVIATFFDIYLSIYQALASVSDLLRWATERGCFGSFSRALACNAPYTVSCLRLGGWCCGQMIPKSSGVSIRRQLEVVLNATLKCATLLGLELDEAIM